jgi:hypothetical protein
MNRWEIPKQIEDAVLQLATPPDGGVYVTSLTVLTRLTVLTADRIDRIDVVDSKGR